MMNHFKLQSLVFYGVAIGSVLLLFKVVTAYGEANLKAASSIEGRYRLSLDQNLPDCLQLSDLVLNIQQSGIYLNGSLLTVENDAQQTKNAQNRPSLTGKLINQQLQLSGNVPISSICKQPVGSTALAIAISSQLQGDNLTGKLTLNQTSREIQFTAKRQKPTQPTGNSDSH